MPSAQIEQLAAEILSETKTLAPVDAFVLADEHGLLLTPVGPYDEGFVCGEIRFNARAPHRDQQEYVIRCVAREALARSGHYVSQASISQLARALMLPRAAFDARANFAQLQRQHVHASAALIGARKGDAFSERPPRAAALAVVR
jgi:hypothetical protein